MDFDRVIWAQNRKLVNTLWLNEYAVSWQPNNRDAGTYSFPVKVSSSSSLPVSSIFGIIFRFGVAHFSPPQWAHHPWPSPPRRMGSTSIHTSPTSKAIIYNLHSSPNFWSFSVDFFCVNFFAFYFAAQTATLARKFPWSRCKSRRIRRRWFFPNCALVVDLYIVSSVSEFCQLQF